MARTGPSRTGPSGTRPSRTGPFGTGPLTRRGLAGGAAITTVLVIAAVVSSCIPAGVGSAANPSAAHPSAAHPTVASTRKAAVTLSNDSGIVVDSSHWVDQRLLDITVSSTALAAPVGVRVLVPADYQADPGVRFPTLYLLHGGGGTYTDWTTGGRAEQLTARLPLIVVMPDAGKGGWYSDWSNSGAAGPPQWETFHIDQLIPWVDANFRTIAARRGRAIAGLSMGGFGAMSYAARHPQLFAAAASFSGAVDTNDPGLRYLVDISPIIDGGPPGAIYGSSLFDGSMAEAHNPYNLAASFRGMHVALYTGDGFPGPLDPRGPPGAAGYDYQEFAVHAMNTALSRRLGRLGIPHTFDDYGNGTHSFPYWNRDLRLELPAIMTTLSQPTSANGERPGTDGRDQAARDSVPLAPGPTGSPTTAVAPGTTLSVASSGTDNGACSDAAPCRTVSQAVSVAAPGDRISVGPGTFVGNVAVTKPLTIEGSPGRTTMVGSRRSPSATVTVTSGGTATLGGLIIQNPDPLGDGVDSSGAVTIEDASLSHCGNAGLDVLSGTAVVSDAVISDNGTYGVASEGTATVDDSTIADNDYGVANDGAGTVRGSTITHNDSAGVVTLRGSTTVVDSTISNNAAEGLQASSGKTSVEDSTITDNGFDGVANAPSPYAPAAVITIVASTISDNSPSGLVAPAPIAVAGTIADGNARGDCSGSLTDAGYNLSSDGTCGLSGISSISAADPDLGPLRYNGGPTPTQAPARNSRAVDAIPRKAVADVGGQGVPLCAGTTDQRGVHRPQAVRRDRCDIGAIELAVGPAIPRQLLSRGG